MEQDKFIEDIEKKYKEFKTDLEKSRSQAFFNEIWYDYIQDVYINQILMGCNMKNWQARVVKERDELAERMAKFDEFLNTFDSGTSDLVIDDENYYLLKLQRATMSRFVILNMRIDKFKEN